MKSIKAGTEIESLAAREALVWSSSFLVDGIKDMKEIMKNCVEVKGQSLGNSLSVD